MYIKAGIDIHAPHLSPIVHPQKKHALRLPQKTTHLLVEYVWSHLTRECVLVQFQSRTIRAQPEVWFSRTANQTSGLGKPNYCCRCSVSACCPENTQACAVIWTLTTSGVAEPETACSCSTSCLMQ